MRRVVGMVALATACGLLPQDDLTGRRIGDGTAPWQDLGTVELCLGSRRIGPRGSAIGGLCTPDTAGEDRPCAADDECASREQCVCGRCTIKYCSGAAECGPGRVCTFTQNRCDVPCTGEEDCGRRESCLNGVCRGVCDVDEDCQTGEVCATQGTRRLCIVDPCAADGECQADEFCSVQREPRVALAPTVLAVPSGGSTFAMWLEMSDRTDDDRAIWRAVSDDGIAWRFSPAEPVFEAGGDAHAPSVVRDGDGYRLYYETTGGIDVATSDDGTSFGTPSRFLAGDVHAPAAAATPDGDLLVFVEVGDRAGIALVSGGSPVTVLDPGDVTDPLLWRDVEAVGSPSVLIEEGELGEPTIRLWFDAFGVESASSVQFGELVPTPPNDSIGFASAPLGDPAGLVLWPFNPVFDRVQTFLQHRAERSPAVVRVPGREEYLLYYEGRSADGLEQDGIGVARTPAEPG